MASHVVDDYRSRHDLPLLRGKRERVTPPCSRPPSLTVTCQDDGLSQSISCSLISVFIFTFIISAGSRLGFRVAANDVLSLRACLRTELLLPAIYSVPLVLTLLLPPLPTTPTEATELDSLAATVLYHTRPHSHLKPVSASLLDYPPGLSSARLLRHTRGFYTQICNTSAVLNTIACTCGHWRAWFRQLHGVVPVATTSTLVDAWLTCCPSDR